MVSQGTCDDLIVNTWLPQARPSLRRLLHTLLHEAQVLRAVSPYPVMTHQRLPLLQLLPSKDETLPTLVDVLIVLDQQLQLAVVEDGVMWYVSTFAIRDLTKMRTTDGSSLRLT